MTKLLRALGAFLSLACIAGCGVHFTIRRHTNPPSVILIGDSITYNWSVFDPSAFAANPQWIDEGVTGENSNSIAARFKDDVIQLRPDIVQIIAGTNDVYPGWELCKNSQIASGRINSCANVMSMVNMAKAADIKVILGTIPPWGPGGLPETADPSPERYTRIAQWNNWLIQYGAAQGITVVDYHAALESPNHETYVPALTVDGVHPSSAGFAVMTPLFIKATTAQ